MEQNGEKYDSFRIAVPADYEELFSHFYFADNKSNKTITKTLLPSYQTILIFSFGGSALLNSKNNSQIEISKCIVLGTIRKAFDYSLYPRTKILVANFKDDAFYRFFGNTSLAENLPVNPDELLNKNCFTSIWYELNKIADVSQQVNYILEFCSPYIAQRNNVAEQLSKFTKNSLNPIKSIASRNNQTERNIQIKQKKYFGYSAKEINRYQRFLKAIEYIEKITSKVSKEDWFTIINDCGYYDQSQLINDFKHYINISPTEYLKFQQDICNPVN
ncbi:MULTISPECIES: helix-turn-helix domain-containing protein [unclassified Cellulophaga]|uniref:helix-turn-helix domain-containing protein n=1 Tax=unclassified Cellulophaga TaxID=2634405 RepID=UPI0026E235AA|nr:MULTISPECIES: AraC family transcriptional regulator [unclassified Cellulophaga]MDO6492858.1 AraC family transcriptional regulator [Cellulophaga sp. 2_MG-2023]MDO6496360.1 AraC family transcriptional regulator [Cellulophaga sp. 3_MG-2023]